MLYCRVHGALFLNVEDPAEDSSVSYCGHGISVLEEILTKVSREVVRKHDDGGFV